MGGCKLFAQAQLAGDRWKGSHTVLNGASFFPHGPYALRMNLHVISRQNGTVLSPADPCLVLPDT